MICREERFLSLRLRSLQLTNQMKAIRDNFYLTHLQACSSLNVTGDLWLSDK
jgi:hypothetical protein